MKLKSLLLLICFILIATTIYAVDFKNTDILDESKRQNIINGFWNFGFPVSSVEYGYIFLPEKKFIYFRAYGDHTGYEYITVGEWKEENLRIYLKPIRTYNNKNGIFVKEPYPTNEWLYVCDLRSYNHYWFPSSDDKYYPPAISIKIFDHGKLTHYVNNYFKFYDVQRTKRDFDHLIKKYLNK